MTGVRIVLGYAPTLVCGCISARFCIGLYIYTMAYLQDECSVGLFTYCIYQVYSRSCEPMLGRLNPLAYSDFCMKLCSGP